MRAGATLAGTAALALGGLLAACGGGGSAGPVQTLTQPPSAAKVAHQLGAAGFTDCGSAPGGGVTDSGTAYLGGKRIGIDTFPGAGVRDQWKKTAASFGVSPRWQGPAWVAYNATSQTAPMAASDDAASRPPGGSHLAAPRDRGAEPREEVADMGYSETTTYALHCDWCGSMLKENMTSKVVPPGMAELALVEPTPGTQARQALGGMTHSPSRNVILCRTCKGRTVEEFLAWLEETAPGTVEGTVSPDGEGLVRYQSTTWQPWVPPPGSDTTGKGYRLAPDIASFLRKHPGSSYDEIAQGIGQPRSTVTGHMREAAHHGELRLEVEAGQDGRQAVPLRFRLAK